MQTVLSMSCVRPCGALRPQASSLQSRQNPIRQLSASSSVSRAVSGHKRFSAPMPLRALGSEDTSDGEWLGDEGKTDDPAASWGEDESGSAAVAVAEEPAPNAKVFVANVPWASSRKELGFFFQENCGEVVDVNILMGRDGRPKGIAFVEFESADSAAAAVEQLHGADFEGRNLVVEMATPREERPPRERRDSYGSGSGSVESARLWVASLSYDTDWMTLKDYFKEAGEVVYASVSEHPDGSSKGCGIVEMSSVEEAQTAIEMFNGSELDGREIFVREDRKSFDNRKRPYEGSDSYGRQQNRGRQGGRPADWDCPSCGANVFGSKHECYKCGEPKPAGAGGDSYGGGYDSYGEGQSRGRGSRGNYERRQPEVRDGDWTCPECGANVFASKSECYRCGCPKHPAPQS